jgi:hypothetical protein
MFEWGPFLLQVLVLGKLLWQVSECAHETDAIHTNSQGDFMKAKTLGIIALVLASSSVQAQDTSGPAMPAPDMNPMAIMEMPMIMMGEMMVIPMKMMAGMMTAAMGMMNQMPRPPQSMEASYVVPEPGTPVAHPKANLTMNKSSHHRHIRHHAKSSAKKHVG